MALTNSNTMIAAANQIVQALNELTQAVSGIGSIGINDGSDMVKAIRILTAAIASENANVTGDLPDSVDYSTIGLAVRIAPTDEELPISVADKLQAIYDKLTEMQPYSNEIEEMLHSISSVLGYTPGILDQYEE
jgi:hypothetical protein